MSLKGFSRPHVFTVSSHGFAKDALPPFGHNCRGQLRGAAQILLVRAEAEA